MGCSESKQMPGEPQLPKKKSRSFSDNEKAIEEMEKTQDKLETQITELKENQNSKDMGTKQRQRNERKIEKLESTSENCEKTVQILCEKEQEEIDWKIEKARKLSQSKEITSVVNEALQVNAAAKKVRQTLRHWPDPTRTAHTASMQNNKLMTIS